MNVRQQQEVQAAIRSLTNAVNLLQRYEAQPLPSAEAGKWAQAFLIALMHDGKVGGVLFETLEELERSLPPRDKGNSK